MFESLFLENPIIHEIEVVALPYKRFSKHADNLLVVWPLLELQFARVVEEVAELLRIAFSQIVYASRCLLDLNLFVLLFLRLGWQSLPGQVAPKEVHEHEAYLFKIISSSLFNSQVCV